MSPFAWSLLDLGFSFCLVGFCPFDATDAQVNDCFGGVASIGFGLGRGPELGPRGSACGRAGLRLGAS